MEINPKINNTPEKIKSSMNAYARFSTLAFQMVAIILLGVFIGYKLDKYLHINNHVLLVLFSFFFVVIALVVMIKSIQTFK